MISHHRLETTKIYYTCIREGRRLKVHERVKLEGRKLNCPKCIPNRTDGRTLTESI